VYSLEQWNEQICSLEGKMRNEVIGAMKAAMSAVVQVLENNVASWEAEISREPRRQLKALRRSNSKRSRRRQLTFQLPRLRRKVYRLRLRDIRLL